MTASACPPTAPGPWRPLQWLRAWPARAAAWACHRRHRRQCAAPGAETPVQEQEQEQEQVQVQVQVQVQAEAPMPEPMPRPPAAGRMPAWLRRDIGLPAEAAGHEALAATRERVMLKSHWLGGG
ncbi:hypothetical protein [Aquabacterium sp. OR-4]|uniref:hypothetical protein n=1 Tax=Aquabacterium sp. OR-4 TaxID=2978127 RepID=UPI0021B234C6|nr:hypothetical protein [Aquabacterium sp. OR-4]MDT7837014.1 hypothetical protein [Aquabacterium sp. OR-4]